MSVLAHCGLYSWCQVYRSTGSLSGCYSCVRCPCFAQKGSLLLLLL